MAKKRIQPGYGIWMALTVLFTLAAITTLIPAAASKPCLLGYPAHCSFTPVSTLICAALALAACFIRAKMFVRQ